MDQITEGLQCVHASTGLKGTIVRVENGGKAGEFAAETGTTFTVWARECEPADWEPDELERLLMEHAPLQKGCRTRVRFHDKEDWHGKPW